MQSMVSRLESEMMLSGNLVKVVANYMKKVGFMTMLAGTYSNGVRSCHA